MKIFKIILIIVSVLGIIILLSLNFVFSKSLEYNNKIKLIRDLSSVLGIKKIEQVSMVQIEKDLPVHITIPVISVNASFEYIGLTLTGEMESPKDPTKVGWYRLGTIPGGIGSSVIAGHFGYKNNTLGVFDNLSKVKIGDKIYIEDENKNTTIFIVSKIKNYKYTDDASDVFNSTDGLSHLNLITCGGTWNKVLKNYSNRTVVFSDKELL
ncbi:MAG: class F sortase [Candidatus Paceibacterota bacterium]